jgi:succinate dehydrogenase / fumarate reductase, membrane anchor subunit
MATTVDRPIAPVRRRSRPETVGWVFMRLSGVALLFLALGHFAIQHVINDVHDLSLGFVAARWGSLGWRVYDALLLSLALVHGLNGLRVVVDDYVRPPTLNRVLKWAIIIVGAALIVIGSVTLIGGVSATGG